MKWRERGDAVRLSSHQLTIRAVEQSRQGPEEHCEKRWQEEEAQEEGKLRHLHLQSVEAGPPRHWHLVQGHDHHELVRQRHLWTHRRWVVSFGPLQQALDHHEPRDPDGRPSSLARWIGQARRLWRHQGCYQIHKHQVDFLSSAIFLSIKQIGPLQDGPPFH